MRRGRHGGDASHHLHGGGPAERVGGVAQAFAGSGAKQGDSGVGIVQRARNAGSRRGVDLGRPVAAAPVMRPASRDTKSARRWST